MPSPADLTPRRPPLAPSTSTRLDNLRFIATSMESAASFTAVPGWGGVAMGAPFGRRGGGGAGGEFRSWLLVWMVEAALALGVGVLAMTRKAAPRGVPVLSRPAASLPLDWRAAGGGCAAHGRSFYPRRARSYVPGVWLLLYGAAW